MGLVSRLSLAFARRRPVFVPSSSVRPDEGTYLVMADGIKAWLPASVDEILEVWQERPFGPDGS